MFGFLFSNSLFKCLCASGNRLFCKARQMHSCKKKRGRSSKFSEGASRGGQSGGREAGGKVVRTNLGKQKSASF